MAGGERYDELDDLLQSYDWIQAKLEKTDIVALLDDYRHLEGDTDAHAVTPDGRRAVSGSDDKTLKVWDLETGALICTHTCEGAVYEVSVAPDGPLIVAGDSADRVYLLHLEND